MSSVRSMLTLTAGIAIASTLGACGGSSSPAAPPPPPATTLPACTQSVVFSGSDSWGAGELGYNDFSVPDSGRLDITVDWTYASSKIGVYVVPVNTCTLDQFNARSCNFLVRSEPSNVKPRKISTPNFAAGNYRWLIANFSDSAESISLQFVLSKGSCAALTGSRPVASTADGLPPLRRLIRFGVE